MEVEVEVRNRGVKTSQVREPIHRGKDENGPNATGSFTIGPYLSP